MVLDDIEVSSRIDSPDNLVNRLRALTKPASGVNKLNGLIPSLPPTADDVIKDLDDKLAGSSIKSKASKLLIDTMNQLEMNLDSATEPSKLARVAESLNRIIDSHTPKKENTATIGQVIIYTPTVREEKEYPIIDVRRTED